MTNFVDLLDHVRLEDGCGQALQHEVETEEEDCGVEGAIHGGVTNPSEVKHSSAAKSEQERIERGNHGSECALGMSDQFQYLKSHLDCNVS